jgi:hypothetical protein
MNGIEADLQARYSERQWRLLTHPRSLASGAYARGDSVTSAIPLHSHQRMVEKGFTLVRVDVGSGAFSAPYCELVE